MRLLLAGFILSATPSAQGSELASICPDRPGRGTSPCTVAPGHSQIEVGLFDESFQHRDGVTTDTGSAGATLVKYGVNDHLDIEAGMAPYLFQRIHDGAGTATASGVGDLYLHAKYNPLTGEGPFALALDPYLKLPVAGRLGNGAVEGGFVLPMAYELGGNWSLAMSPEADLLLNASGGSYHSNLANAVGLTRGFGSVTLGAEIWTSQDMDPAGTVSQYSAGMAAAWLVDNDTQLDFGVSFGLNRPTPDFEAYTGVALRF